MRTLKFDIMKPIGGNEERFVTTMHYQYSPIFRFDFKKFYEWIIEKRPSLKGKPFNVYPDDKVLKVLYFNQDIDKIRYEI